MANQHHRIFILAEKWAECLCGIHSCQMMLGLIAFMLLITQSVSSQVYNYDPARYHNFETNPTILATEYRDGMLAIHHQGVPLPSKNFNYNAVKYSKYLESIYMGAGLIAANTMQDSLRYSHAGLALAYRNILFNSVHVKIGAVYKLINRSSPTGTFDYYTFHSADSALQNESFNNINYSFSFSSPSDIYYISFSMLNNSLPWYSGQNDVVFPKYYVINVGNFSKLFGDPINREVSYTFISKQLSNVNISTHSHNLIFLMPYHITRKSMLRYGGRTGYADNAYFHLTPVITYYTKTGGYAIEGFSANLSVDLGYKSKNLKSQFKPITQLSLTFKL